MKRLMWVIPILLAVNGSAQTGQPKIVDRILAQVNDDIITLSDLNRQMAEIRQELSTRYSGEQLEEEVKKAQSTALDELIREKLLVQKATELGFGSNIDVQVSAAIERIRKQNNIKDMQEFEQALAQQGMTLLEFRDKIRKQILAQGLIQEFVGSRITLTSQEIEKYYRDNETEYTTPEEVSLSEIIIPTEGDDGSAMAKASEILSRLKKGESFATLASQYSKGPTANKGGNIGSYTLPKLNPDIAKAIANVKEGDVTEIQKITEGYVIYRVDSRKPARVRPLDEVRDEIKNKIWQQKFTPEYDRYIAQLKEDAYIQIFGDIKP
jgi:peptidyl-prolyl cis-trans isomerase SurA